MVEKSKNRLPHLLVRDTATTTPYTKPRRKIESRGPKIPQRDRKAHAERLISQIAQGQEREADIIREQKAFGLDAGNGIYLSFESEPGFDLKFESLEFQRSGIELCAIKKMDDQTIATVFIPEGKLDHFLRKISRYRDEDTKPRIPDGRTKAKNKDLVESISAIKLAALEKLWIDDPELLPDEDDTIWWEVWLRHSDKVDYEAFLRDHAPQLEMTVSKEAIHFLDRTVLLVYGTKEQMSRSIRLLASIAELRCAKETADFFTGMDRIEQQAWIDKALNHLALPPDHSPYVCILDTGVNDQHPLLKPVADSGDMHTYNPAWGTDDRFGHGTPMAGLAIYGDLTDPLSSGGQIELTHRLESVKVTPDPDHHKDKRLYGAITRESIGRVEINPDRQRVYSMAVTTTDDRDRGKPSSWSAAIDALSSGYEDEQQRLIILSAGNTDPSERHLHPNSNLTDAIHDPGQAWNALTVGAYTDKVFLDTAKYPGWRPVANSGDIAPSSCTSMEWGKTAWPIKPDIVMEGGNMAISPDNGTADYIDDALQLLSTGHQFSLGKQLISFGDTSAATALAARLATMVQAQYPAYWPETLRALLVHSARWTEAMRARFNPLNRQDHFRQLLRYCGYGVPNAEDLFWSTRSSLTLLAQDSIQPFFKEGNRIKTRDINLHAVPWPAEVLRDLEGTQVEMRVTLSYFVEPNPGERGWANKYRYVSHGLRFDVKRPLENLDAFQQRINQKARDEEYNRRPIQDSGQWTLGERLRALGSIHSDTWHGTAAELADRGHVAVYPVLGWWKERPNLQRWGKRARYALVITIRTPGVETDIYTPVANQIATVVEV